MNMPKDMSCKLSISEIQSYPYQSSCSRPVLSPLPPALPAAILRQKSLQRQTVRGAGQNVIPIGFDVAPEVILCSWGFFRPVRLIRFDWKCCFLFVQWEVYYDYMLHTSDILSISLTDAPSPFRFISVTSEERLPSWPNGTHKPFRMDICLIDAVRHWPQIFVRHNVLRIVPVHIVHIVLACILHSRINT